MTRKQEIFIKEYVLTKNATQSAINAGFAPKNAGNTAHKLLKDPKISQKVEEEFQKIIAHYDYSIDDVKHGIGKIAEDDKAKHADKLRAWELIGKILGLFKDNNVSVAIYQDMGKEKVDRVRSMLKARQAKKPINRVDNAKSS